MAFNVIVRLVPVLPSDQRTVAEQPVAVRVTLPPGLIVVNDEILTSQIIKSKIEIPN